MRKACKGYQFATSRTQRLHAEWELGGLMTVSAGLLQDILRYRIRIKVLWIITRIQGGLNETMRSSICLKAREGF